jgi:hypothetical protein
MAAPRPPARAAGGPRPAPRGGALLGARAPVGGGGGGGGLAAGGARRRAAAAAALAARVWVCGSGSRGA